jgi:hypothetical protein
MSNQEGQLGGIDFAVLFHRFRQLRQFEKKGSNRSFNYFCKG